jgi:hypothetical protein
MESAASLLATGARRCRGGQTNGNPTDRGGKLLDQTAKATTPRRDALPSNRTSATLTEDWGEIHGCRKDSATGPALSDSAAGGRPARRRRLQAVGLRPGLPAETAWRTNPSRAAIGFSRWRAVRLPVHHWAQKASPRRQKVMDGESVLPWSRGHKLQGRTKANQTGQVGETKSTVPYPLWSDDFQPDQVLGGLMN